LAPNHPYLFSPQPATPLFYYAYLQQKVNTLRNGGIALRILNLHVIRLSI